jgi:hypothetical protein
MVYRRDFRRNGARAVAKRRLSFRRKVSDVPVAEGTPSIGTSLETITVFTEAKFFPVTISVSPLLKIGVPSLAFLTVTGVRPVGFFVTETMAGFLPVEMERIGFMVGVCGAYPR